MIWKVGFRGLVSLPWQQICSLCFVSTWISGQEIKWLFHTLCTYQICNMVFIYPKFKMVLRGRTRSKQNCWTHLASFKQCTPWNDHIWSLALLHKVPQKPFWREQHWLEGKCYCYGEINSVQKLSVCTMYLSVMCLIFFCLGLFFLRFKLLNSLQRLYSVHKNLEFHEIILLLGRNYGAFQYFKI